jgi:hypothetical protein
MGERAVVESLDVSSCASVGEHYPMKQQVMTSEVAHAG